MRIQGDRHGRPRPPLGHRAASLCRPPAASQLRGPHGSPRDIVRGLPSPVALRLRPRSGPARAPGLQVGRDRPPGEVTRSTGKVAGGGPRGAVSGDALAHPEAAVGAGWAAWAPWQKRKHKIQVGPASGTWCGPGSLSGHTSEHSHAPMFACVCVHACLHAGLTCPREQPSPQHVKPAGYPRKLPQAQGPPPGHREPGLETGSEQGRAGSPQLPRLVLGRAAASDPSSPGPRAESTCTHVHVCVSQRHEHVWS